MRTLAPSDWWVTHASARALRERGLLVTPSEAIDAVRSLEVVDLTDRDDVHLALRAILVAARGPATFEELFDTFWVEQPATTTPAPVPLPRSRDRSRGHGRHRSSGAAAGCGGDETLSVPRASDREALGQRDLTTFRADELAEIQRIAAGIARRLAARPVGAGARRRAAPAFISAARCGNRSAPAARSPSSRAASAGCERRRSSPCAMCRGRWISTVVPAAVFYALQNGFARVRRRLQHPSSRVTPSLNGESYRDALARLSRAVQDWSGGTRIGASLAAFNAGWPRLVTRRTVVLIVSDGWDTGEAAALPEALHVIARRAGRVIWLNPLLGSPSYEPLTRGMQAALPYVDVFAPVHNLASLRELVRYLRI